MLGPLRRKNSEEKATAALRRRAFKELREFALARRLETPEDRLRFDIVGARLLRPGDAVLVLADDMLPADGEVVDGAARVDESVLVGPGEAVLRSAAFGRAHAAAGTRIVSGWLVLRVTAGLADCLLQRLISERGG